MQTGDLEPREWRSQRRTGLPASNMTPKGNISRAHEVLNKPTSPTFTIAASLRVILCANAFNFSTERHLILAVDEVRDALCTSNRL